MVYNKVGSIYTDMIKPLEKQLYSVILSLENDERQAIDKISPHCRDIYYDSINLQGFQEIRKNISSIAEVVILVSLWKDMSIRNFSFLIPGGLVVFFTRDTSLTFWPNTVYWCISKRDVGIELPEWSSVAKGKMTPEAFVELIKARQVGVRTGDAEVIPCVISHPGTGIHFSGSTEDGINFLLKELIQARENLAAQEAAKIQDNKVEPGHIFAIEPYNRSKHGDEIDMLMDDKGTTQRFKIGEDGRSVKLTTTAKGQADGVTARFTTQVKRAKENDYPLTNPMDRVALSAKDPSAVTIDEIVALSDGAYRKSADGSAIMMNTPNKEAVRIIFEREV